MCSPKAEPTNSRGGLGGTQLGELPSSCPPPHVITTNIPTARTISVCRNNERHFIRINYIMNIMYYVHSLHSYAIMSFDAIIDGHNTN